jgi:hypothetical protein
MSYQELQYLRDELNRLCDFRNEQINKAIGTVLVTWGSLLGVFGFVVGNKGDGMLDISAVRYQLLCFLYIIIIFVSNEVLFILIEKSYVISNDIFKMAAYILVFYEKIPRNTVWVRGHLCWESILFDMKTRYPENRYKSSIECISLFYISLISEIIIIAAFFYVTASGVGVPCIFSYITVITVIIISIRFVHIVLNLFKYSHLKDDYHKRAEHLYTVFRYSLEIGYYSKQDIKNRFGDIYDNCKKEYAKYSKQRGCPIGE